MEKLLRLRRLVKEHGSRYPDIWKRMDHFREMRGKQGIPDWPSWCFLPMSAYYMAVLERTGNRMMAGFEASILAALGSWRATQGVYRFDPDLYQALTTTPLHGKIPSEVLHRMPEWCVYIETPGLESGPASVHGTWLHLEYDVNTGREELRFLMDASMGGKEMLYPFAIHLGPWSLDTACTKALDVAQRNRQRYLGVRSTEDWDTTAMTQEMRELVSPVLSLLLYLCADEPDYADEPPRKPAPKRVRGKLRMFPPDQPKVWDVGARIGAALRKTARPGTEEKGTGTRSTTRPRPHIRRAHWHTYRVGPGRKETRIRWLAPVPVNVRKDEEAELPAVLHPVQDQSGPGG